ncbi:UDP-glucose 4-epimerase GalE [Patescibacteria group bacterium]|nr:UDP-glucose 4-epimerase GalE [Patescibacteria group bacterium]
MKKIIVTGGAGFIGAHLVKLLADQPDTMIHVIDNFSQSRNNILTRSNVEYHELDICDAEKLTRLFLKLAPDTVFHFAAIANVPDSVTNPAKYYQTNVMGSYNILEAMRVSGCTKIIFSSSASVYGEPQSEIILEDHPKNPTNPYGRTKLVTEEMLKEYFTAYSISSISFRYFCAAGADPDGELGEYHSPETHVIPSMLETILGRRETFSIFGTDYPTPDGTGIRDYIHVVDLAQAHICALTKLDTDLVCTQYNLGINKGFSVRELIDTAEKITGTKLTYIEKDRRPGDPSRLIADATGAMNELSWKPQYTNIEDIIATAYRSLKR